VFCCRVAGFTGNAWYFSQVKLGFARQRPAAAGFLTRQLLAHEVAGSYPRFATAN